jgi:uncharacterized membrane protein YgcG
MAVWRRRVPGILLLAFGLALGPLSLPTSAQVVPAAQAPTIKPEPSSDAPGQPPVQPAPQPQSPSVPTPQAQPPAAPSANPPATKSGFPALTGRVVDSAGMLDAATVSRLTADLAAHEAATSEQIVVVTVPSLNGMPIEDYGNQLGRQWGIGQKGKDNGALLIIARDDRKLRIEVGYGLEGKLTDAQSSVIINQIITPAFRQNDYAGGVSRGVAAMLDAVSDKHGEPPKIAPADVAPADTGSNPIELFIGFMVLLFIVFVRFNPFRRKRTFGERVLGAVTGGLIGGSSRGGFGGFGGGGGGGGFRGGGGGFGGGGASGGW